MKILQNTQTQTCHYIVVMGVPDYSKFTTIIHELICVNNMFQPATIKNDNGAVAMRNFFVRHEQKQQLNKFKKVQHGVIKDLLNCAPMLLFFYQMKSRTFHITQNDSPKMEKLSVYTNKLSIFPLNNPPVSGCICLIGRYFIHLIPKYFTFDNLFVTVSRKITQETKKSNLISDFRILQGIPLFQAVSASQTNISCVSSA